MQVQRHLDQLGGVSERETAPELAILLLHLGGPASVDEIEAFYQRLWSGPEFSGGLLSRLRGRKKERSFDEIRDHFVRGYELIGGRSPLGDLVQSQALALENRMNGHRVMAPSDPRGAVMVRAAFCYAEPSIDAAVAELVRVRAKHVVVIPLYPQFSTGTTGTCLAEFDRAAVAHKLTSPTSRVESFHDHPPFLKVLVERTRRVIDLVPLELRPDAFLLFALHSPAYARADSDAYLQQVEETAQHIMRAVEYGEARSGVGFVTCHAPTRFLSPTVAEFAAERGRAGVKSIVVVPVSHVTDSFETLHDLDIEAYQAAVEAGVKQFRRVQTLNADPTFIGALAELVRRQLPQDLWRELAQRATSELS